MAKTKAKTEEQGNGGGEKVNKMDCVRQVLDQIGYDAKPKAIQEEVKNRFGFEMDANMISNYKSYLSKRASGQSGLMRGGRGRRKGGEITMEDVRIIREMTQRLGSDRVRELTQMFS